MLAWVIVLLFSLLPASVFAATIYVDPGCADGVLYVPATRACTGGSDTVKATITAGVGALNAGDKLFIRGGTYNNSFASAVPNGTNAAARTVISAYPTSRPCGADYNMTWREWGDCVANTVYEDVVIKGSSSRIAMEGTREWIVFEGLQFPGPHGSNFPIRVACTGNPGTNPPTCDAGVTYACSSNLVFAGLKVGNSVASSFISHAHTDVWVLASEVYNCGSDSLDHCFYWEGLRSILYRNYGHHSKGLGYQLYRQVTQPTCYPLGEDMWIERNIATDNASCGFLASGWNKDATFVNNFSTRNSCGLQFNSSHGGSHEGYNNTLVGNGSRDIVIGNGAHNAVLQGNLYRTKNISATATGTTITGNYEWCSACAAPALRDPSEDDYRPLPTDTLLVGQGPNLFALGVEFDADGNARPAAPDPFTIGAYEVSDAAPTPFDFSLTHNVIEEEEPQIPQGNTADIVITVNLTAGSEASVGLTAENLPPLTTASFNPANCTPSGGDCTSTLTLDTANGTPEGGYSITVKGTSGATVRTTQFDVNVICQ